MSVRIKERLELKKLTTFAPNKKLPVHSWFPYLQAYSCDLIARFLGELQVNKDQVVLDPFCGVGTTNLTCKQKGISSFGLDLSPLACFVTRVKTRDHSTYSSDFLKTVLEKLFEPNNPCPKPDHPIMDKSFRPEILDEILVIKNNIESIDSVELREFFLLAFLRSLESLSFIVRDGAHYRYDFKKNIPEVMYEIQKNAINMINDLHLQEKMVQHSETTSVKKRNGEVLVFEADARKMTPVKNASIDYIFTSPPYCNRDNYIAQFKIELFLGGFLSSFGDYRSITFESFRSHIEAKPPPEPVQYRNQAVDEFVEALSRRKLSNPRNPVMIKGYFEDMYLFLQQAYRVLKNDSKMLLVIGNTAWSGLYLESDRIICQIAEEIGFVAPEIWVTRYKLNSAQQIARYGKIRIRESIIALTKE